MSQRMERAEPGTDGSGGSDGPPHAPPFWGGLGFGAWKRVKIQEIFGSWEVLKIIEDLCYMFFLPVLLFMQ